ncbi:23S rRNA (uracil(747)-C(5))-methyltransferase RlmC [Rheinheimera sp.]|uniref:23S rRNA (uracil(747)-C(5))-methyltransferase RlmC n=1 Tax=Rheinheimera sp. TaxID=1869214 RepID=UPI00307E5FA3
MYCAQFVAGRCRSCTEIELDYSEQLQHKQQQWLTLLEPFTPDQVLAPYPSPQSAFRTKAKMVVSGTAEQPVLGLMHSSGEAVDLTSCLLYPTAFAPAFALVQQFIQRARLQPYQVAERKGELKFILLSQSSFSGRFMLRFVLRSQNHLASIRKHLPWLQQQWPELELCSVNLQPVAMAQLEGDTEILLTDTPYLAEQLNQVPLYLTPQSFFQTNPAVAAALYQSAVDWTTHLPLQSVWDLFCGVGGFGLHLASSRPGIQLTGIEISASAIASARKAAAELQLEQPEFMALDANAFAMAQQQAPDLLLVNPPRRGLGPALCQQLLQLAPAYLLYSSCNPHSLAKDLAQLTLDYRLIKARLFDMFPHSQHAEVLVLLSKK